MHRSLPICTVGCYICPAVNRRGRAAEHVVARVRYLGLKAMRVERQVLFWLSAALVLVLLIALLRGVILPFVAGIVIAYFMNPAADRLTYWGAVSYTHLTLPTTPYV